MKKSNVNKTILITALIAFVLGTAPAMSANYLKDISVRKAGDTTVVIISTSQPCEFEKSMVSGIPQRIIIDLKGIVNAWTNKKFTSLPFKSMQSIRTSQFQTEPLVSRVVLDLNRQADFTAESLNGDVVVKFAAAPDEGDFAEWHAQTTASKPAPIKTQQVKAAPTKAPTKTASSGVKIEAYPKRKVVGYGTSALRDPFMPLVGASIGHLNSELPLLDNLTLVGILEDVDGNRALLEDAEGNGYILFANDKVKNGYLVTVTDTKAIFQITEYGWTRTVALELDVPELR